MIRCITSAQRLATALGLALLGIAACAPAAMAVAPANDFYFNGASIPYNEQRSGNNFEATYSDTSPLMGEGDLDERYTPAGANTCEQGNQQMVKTVWFRIVGTGGPIVVSTEGSSFDTMLAWWTGDFGDSDCNDDIAGVNNRRSRVAFTSTAGAVYHLQLGAFSGSNPLGGDYRITALSNDVMSHPETIVSTSGTGELFNRSNTGASGTGETLSCPGGPSYNNTVWFRWVAPDLGTVTFHVNGFPIAVAAYRGGTQIGCDYTAATPNSAKLSVPVDAGQEILVQVGGLAAGGGGNWQGIFGLHVPFARDCDRDNDDVPDRNRAACGGQDCDDGRGDVKPGLDDIVNNADDENCDNYKDFDRDGDGTRVTEPAGGPNHRDCDDRPGIGARSEPGKRDVRGNRLNEDCLGRPARAALIPTGISISYGPHRGGFRPSSFVIKRVLAGSRVRVSCSGPGCSGSFNRKFKKRVARLSLADAFDKMKLRPGAKLRVKVSAPNGEWIGKARTDTMRRGKPVKTSESCLTAGGKRRRCPKS